MWHGALSVFRFEVRRTLTLSRISVWLLLIMFPVFIVSVLKRNEDYIERNLALEFRSPQLRRVDEPQPDAQHEAGPSPVDGAVGADAAEPRAKPRPPSYMTWLWAFVFFGLIPEIITLFGLLLWVPALVHAELEGHTWIYLAVRPRGRVGVLLGKYLTAITWTALAGWISATACILIARPENALRMWAAMLGLVTFACLAYGAIYSLLGVWLLRRAMVVAVTYTLIFEFLVSLIPAVINKFTVQYRLRNLLFSWLDWWDFVPTEATIAFLGKEPAWLHILILVAIVVGILGIAAQVVQLKEYATVSDA